MIGTLRSAQAGDLFVLLTPSADEANELRQRQQALQAVAGGQINDPAHLTCQRFSLKRGLPVAQVLTLIERTIRPLPAFPLTAIGLFPMFSRFRQGHVLKWRVQDTPELRNAGTTLEGSLMTLGITPHFPYTSGWVSTLVTALVSVDESNDERVLDPEPFPHHLFVARRALVTRLERDQDFEVLQEFELADRQLHR